MWQELAVSCDSSDLFSSSGSKFYSNKKLCSDDYLKLLVFNGGEDVCVPKLDAAKKKKKNLEKLIFLLNVHSNHAVAD